MRAVVTGSGGFLGRVLMRHLHEAACVHMGEAHWRDGVESADYRDAVVFHLAGRVHQHGGDAAVWKADNTDKTEALALAAAAGGATRFVFMSTLKVHGEETHGRPIRASDASSPGDPYSRSKALAEERLADVSRRTGLAVVTVRPPLVFGSGARANLHAALRLARSAIPLPFASIRNRRSWVHVEDLCALLLICARHEAAPGRAFIAAHASPFSTPQLFAGLRERLGRRPHLFALPPRVIEGLAAMAGQAEAARRLTRSLEADPAATTSELGWQARIALERALDDLVTAIEKAP